MHELDLIVINGVEKEDCPLRETRGLYSWCKYTKINCVYGLTEIFIPESCPLRNGSITIEYKSKKV